MMISGTPNTVSKWSHIIENLGIDKNNKKLFSLICEYAEYRSKNLANYVSLTPSFNDINDQKLIIELRILSKINLTNKILIIKNLNDTKMRFDNTPIERFSYCVEKIQHDIKKSRSDKISEINSISETNVRIDHNERILKIAENIIVSDINERLLYGDILYIDCCLIDNLHEVSTPYKQSLEFVTKYDVI